MDGDWVQAGAVQIDTIFPATGRFLVQLGTRFNLEKQWGLDEATASTMEVTEEVGERDRCRI